MGNTAAPEANAVDQQTSADVISTSNNLPAAHANQFIQALLYQNEELGIIPQRLMADGNRAVCKASMNKAKVIDMTFDVEEPSIKMSRENFDGSRVKLRFQYSSVVSIMCTVHLGVVQKRQLDDVPCLPDLLSSAQKSAVQLPAGKSATAELSCGYHASIMAPQASLSEDQEFVEAILVFTKIGPSGHKNEISDLYTYYSIVKPSENNSKQFGLACQRKGSLDLTRHGGGKTVRMAKEHILSSKQSKH